MERKYLILDMHMMKAVFKGRFGLVRIFGDGGGIDFDI